MNYTEIVYERVWSVFKQKKKLFDKHYMKEMSLCDSNSKKSHSRWFCDIAPKSIWIVPDRFYFISERDFPLAKQYMLKMRGSVD